MTIPDDIYGLGGTTARLETARPCATDHIDHRPVCWIILTRYIICPVPMCHASIPTIQMVMRVYWTHTSPTRSNRPRLPMTNQPDPSNLTKRFANILIIISNHTNHTNQTKSTG